jgi:4-aminobutyrate aminotransferase
MPLGAMVAKKDVMDWPKARTGTPTAVTRYPARQPWLPSSLSKKNTWKTPAWLGLLQGSAGRTAGQTSQHGDVRGKGFMLGVEFVLDRETKQPAEKLRDDIVKKAFERGLMTLGCGKSVIRVTPPLSTSKSEVDEAMLILDEAISLSEKAHQLI